MKVLTNQLYDLLGDQTLRAITDTFYDKIDQDDLLRPMFPDDLTLPRKHQYLFMKQVFGGPREYQEERGNPMMRRRHFPFEIGWEERNRWFDLMIESIKENVDHEEAIKTMTEYMNHMATKIINKGPQQGLDISKPTEL
ncbi:MAG: globin [Candidatus Heimdallarchaeota archaeon]|nr:globin [Candidatus Heimdallarchaeota archaeon]